MFNCSVSLWTLRLKTLIILKVGFPGGSVEKNLPANVGDLGLIPGLERSHREGSGKPLQYSCLGNPMDITLFFYVVFWSLTFFLSALQYSDMERKIIEAHFWKFCLFLRFCFWLAFLYQMLALVANQMKCDKHGLSEF